MSNTTAQTGIETPNTDSFPHLDISGALKKRQRNSDDYMYQENLAAIFAQPTTALCVVDMQVTFCDVNLGGTLETQAITNPIAQLKRAFNQQGKPVFIIYKDSREIGPERAAGGLYEIYPDHESDIVIAKDSDSVFSASKRCLSPHISTYLKQHQIDTLFFVGTNFSLCVGKSAIDALRNNFDSFIVSDATADGKINGRGDPYTALLQTTNQGVRFVSKKQIISALEATSNQQDLDTVTN